MMCRCEGYSLNACWASPTTLASISPERSSRARGCGRQAISPIRPRKSVVRPPLER